MYVYAIDSKVDDLAKAVEERVEGSRDAVPASKDGLLNGREATLRNPEMHELMRVVRSGSPD